MFVVLRIPFLLALLLGNIGSAVYLLRIKSDIVIDSKASSLTEVAVLARHKHKRIPKLWKKGIVLGVRTRYLSKVTF